MEAYIGHDLLTRLEFYGQPFSRRRNVSYGIRLMLIADRIIEGRSPEGGRDAQACRSS
jgi:hypothetical protein